MSRYRLPVFDFDGTLADTLDDVAWCMEETFASHGFDAPDRDAVLATVGLTLDDSFRRLRDDRFSAEELLLWTQTYRAFYAAEEGRRSALFPGVAETLKAINRLGSNVSIVGNKGAGAIQTVLRKFELNDLIAKTFAGDATAHRKPDPALYRAEIEPFFCPIEDGDVLIVGDTKIDLEFAENAGLTACWASYGYGEPDECRKMAPRFVIREFSDLLTIFE